MNLKFRLVTVFLAFL